MNYTQLAIEKAIQGGYNVGPIEVDMICDEKYTHYYLDSLFWQSLGKSLGWDIMPPAKITMYQYDGISKTPIEVNFAEMTVGRAQIHYFIDHLASGKDAESFFKDLLSI